MDTTTPGSSLSALSAPALHFEGANFFRQRLVLSTLSGRPVKITNIRSDDLHPGLREYEVNFIRLLDKITDGARITINNTGTQLRYDPGALVGAPKTIVHDCPESRCVTYWLEGLVLLLPFARNVTKLKLRGVTNDGVDVSVDSFRTVSLVLLKKFFTVKKDALDCVGANFDESGLSLKVERRGCRTVVGGVAGGVAGGAAGNKGKGGSSSSGNAQGNAKNAADLGEVVFHCPTIKKVRPVNFTEGFRCKRVRGVAFTSGVASNFAQRMVDQARHVLNGFLPDVWVFTDANRGELDRRGFGLSLVAESVSGGLKSVDVFSNGDALNTEDAKLVEEMVARGQKEGARALENHGSTSSSGSEEEEEEEADVDMEGPEESDPLGKQIETTRSLDASDIPSCLGRAAAYRLLSEIDLQGTTDTAHQILMIHYVALAEEDEASRVRLGKLTPAAIEYLRLIKDFLGVKFRIREDDDGVLLSAVGIGLGNLCRPTF